MAEPIGLAIITPATPRPASTRPRMAYVAGDSICFKSMMFPPKDKADYLRGRMSMHVRRKRSFLKETMSGESLGGNDEEGCAVTNAAPGDGRSGGEDLLQEFVHVAAQRLGLAAELLH